MIRLFFAIEIPSNIKNEIVKLRDEIYYDDKLYWETKSKYHLTIKFLGDTDENLITKLNEMAENVVTNFNRMELTFANFGFFKRGDIPSVLWLGIKNNPMLFAFSKQLDESLKSLGIESGKRKFFPHLTILRIKNYVEGLKKFENKSADFLSFNCHSISLIKSDLTKQGSIYTTIKKFNLKEE